MRSRFIWVFFVFGIFLSCDGYEKASVSEKEVLRLDSLLVAGQRNGMIWARSPREFCIAQFPALSNEGRLYRIVDQESVGGNDRTIIIERGVLDDEVFSEKFEIEFVWKEGIWRITSYEIYLKRRD